MLIVAIQSISRDKRMIREIGPYHKTINKCYTERIWYITMARECYFAFTTIIVTKSKNEVYP